MSFNQKVWKNRISENPGRRTLTPIDGSDAQTVDVTRAEGTIMEEGDAFSADNMNDLESRIAEGIGAGNENIAPIETTVSENVYTVGQLLIHDGQLYRVIDPIAIGDTLAEDVNIVATSVNDELVDELSANGTRLYMDYQNGKYGYNTDPSRGADTFHPFKDGSDLTGKVRTVYVGSHSSWGGGSSDGGVAITISYDADGNVTGVSGFSSYQNDGTTTLYANGYTVY